MKNSSIILIIFFSIFYGCKRETPLQPLDTPISAYTLHLFGVIGSDTLIADGARVSIDARLHGTADDHGAFTTPILSPGKHYLSIVHGFFANYDSVCQFEDNHEIDIPLEVTAKDFFPLEPGGTWVYRYQYSCGLPSVLDTVPYAGSVGTITWKVLDVESNDSLKTFHCSEIVHQDSSYSRESGLIALSELKDSVIFRLIESIDHRITVELSWDSKSTIDLSWELPNALPTYVNLHRYQSWNTPDSLVFKAGYPPFSAHFTMTVRKALGIFSFYLDNLHPGAHERFYYWLQSYNSP